MKEKGQEAEKARGEPSDGGGEEGGIPDGRAHLWRAAARPAGAVRPGFLSEGWAGVTNPLCLVAGWEQHEVNWPRHGHDSRSRKTAAGASVVLLPAVRGRDGAPKVAIDPWAASRERPPEALLLGSAVRRRPLPVPPRFHDRTVRRVQSQVCKPSSSFCFKIALGIRLPLYSHVSFRMSLSIVQKNFSENFEWNCFESIAQFSANQQCRAFP